MQLTALTDFIFQIKKHATYTSKNGFSIDGHDEGDDGHYKKTLTNEV